VVTIGAHNGTSFINGWMDSIRIVKSALWTSTFSVPNKEPNLYIPSKNKIIIT